MHQLKTFLSDLTIKTCCGEEISPNTNNYSKFFDFFDRFCSAKNRTILYRGSNPESVFQTKLFDIENFARKIFMLGEKSHYFEVNKTTICIDDCSEAVFEFIFKRFHDKVCALNFSNPTSCEKVREFLEKNTLIKDYFSDINNKENFLSKAKEVDDSQKRQILDYYFSLLHTIGKSADGNSYFISTSKNLKTAKKFKKDGIIVVTWVPSSEKNRQIICYNDITELDNFIKKKELPYYTISPYREQEEVCIKGGILPHYIVGYAQDNSFIVNPNLLIHISSFYDFESLLKDGILTDQKDFSNELQKTKYIRGFRCIDGDCYEY